MPTDLIWPVNLTLRLLAHAGRLEMIQMKTLRIWVSVLAALVCMTIGATAHASHFRYGNITWKVPDPIAAPQTVQFTVTAGWRDTLADSITLNFGDGASTNVASTDGSAVDLVKYESG